MKRFCKCAVVVAVVALAAVASARADYVVVRRAPTSHLWITGISVPTYQEAQQQAAQLQSRGYGVRIQQVGPQRPEPPTQRQNVEIWTVPVWYAAPGGQWAVYGTYFVYRYPNGATDNSEPLEVAQALNRAGYYSRFDNTQATFVRMGTR